MIEVASVFAPRGHPSKWTPFVELLGIQRETARYHGHQWTLISDRKLRDFGGHIVPLPGNLMLALITAQLEFLKRWDDSHPAVMLDADCLVARDLHQAFDGSFDIAVTNRPNPTQPINNGAMYFSAGSKRFAIPLFERLLAECPPDCAWGQDQEALARCLSPIPEGHGVFVRRNARIGFLSMKLHNCAPVLPGAIHGSNPFVVHFKGKKAKGWMSIYARRFILSGVHRRALKEKPPRG